MKIESVPERDCSASQLTSIRVGSAPVIMSSFAAGSLWQGIANPLVPLAKMAIASARLPSLPKTESNIHYFGM